MGFQNNRAEEAIQSSSNKIEFFNYDGNIKKALFAGLMGVAAWAVKEYIPPLVNTFKESLHRVITIDADKSPELYEKLEIWLEKQHRIYCSNYVVKNIAEKNDVALTVGYAPALYKINDRVCIIERTKGDSKDSWRKDEKITIKILYTRDMDTVHNIMNEIYSTDLKNENTNRIKITCGWTDFYKNKRGLNTIAMKKEDKEFLINDIQKFIDSKEYYTKRGIVYKRNYMIHGEPGCGKSSLIWALASYFNMDLRIVDISDVNSSSDLQRILARSENTLVVFEDIDAMNANVKKRAELTPATPTPDGACECTAEEKADSNISMSSLLNVFDGINTPDGSICIFTTNHIHKLDKAFLRDGRMDVKLQMGKVGKLEVIENIANNVLSEEEVKLLEENLSDDINIIPSKCQSILMDNSITDAIKKLNKKG